MNPSTDNGSVDYDKVSRIYDTSRVTNTETLEKLIRLLHVDSNSVILDMGCGTGNYIGALRRVAKSVVGIDLSIGMLEQARAKFTDLLLISGDVTSMPFRPESFDAVFAVQVLHHVKEKELFLKEAHRVLKEGACLAIDSCSHRQMRTFWFYHYFPRGFQVDLARIPDCWEIASLLEGHGFSNIGIEISCQDVAVHHEKPEQYLDKNYRDGQSTFHLLSEEEVESGCKKLREDIASGVAESVIREFEVKEARVGGSSIIYGRKTGPLYIS